MSELRTDERGHLVVPTGYQKDWETYVNYDDAAETEEQSQESEMTPGDAYTEEAE